MFKVLVIDDEINFPTAFKFLLESKEGYSVSVASNGREGLEIAKREVPDLIFLDIMMPGEDGFSILKRIKADDQLKETHVIMFTAVDTKSAHAEAETLRADGYMSKPLEMDEMVKAVEHIKAGIRK